MPEDTLSLICELARLMPDQQIARLLNRAGKPTGRGNGWTKARVCSFRSHHILLSQRVNVALKGSVVTEQVGALALKGLAQPVVAYNIPLATSQPGLRVIEGGPQSV